MERTLRASEAGLKLIDKARRNKRWTKQAAIWLQEADVTLATLKRFWAKKPIKKEAFISICKAVEIDYKQVCNDDPKPNDTIRCFWGSAPDVHFFCDRQTELETLTQWITKEKCRLMGITALGGMGKTHLATKLACNLKAKFAGIYWISLREAPLLDFVLEELIKFISKQQEIDLPKSLEARLIRLLDYLSQEKWLIIFDNAESILEANSLWGEYRTEYENYSLLFSYLASRSHQSHIIVTSREPIPEIKHFAGKNTSVKNLQLSGMSLSAIDILYRQGIEADELQLQKLIQHYQGNPLALEIAAGIVRKTFKGDIDAFLEESKTSFQGINRLLSKQFERLSSEEQSVMYWLAIKREPVETQALKPDILSVTATRQLGTILDCLQHRCLLQITATGYTLQNVVMEYVTELVIATANKEITTEQFELLHTHPLIQATAADYLRICQYRVIIQPLLEILSQTLPPRQLIAKLLGTITELRQNNFDTQYGYTPGNIINLLVSLKADLTGTDLSGLTIRQAYLQGIPLNQVNFSYCHFQQCLFSHALGSILTVTFSPDQTLLATGETDGYIRLWRVANGEEVAAWKAHSDWIRVLSFSHDGEKIASGGNDKLIKIWQLSNQECQQVLRGHTDWIWSLKFTKKNNVDLLISTSSDNTARVWSVDTGKTVYTYENLPGLPKVVWSVAFSPDGETFASGSATIVQLWNINTRKWIRDIPHRATRVRALCFSPDGKMLAGSNDNQEVVVWRVATGECEKVLSVPPTAAIWSLQYTPDGAELISSGTDSIQLWDMLDYQPLMTLQQPDSRVRSVAYSENNNLLAVGSDDKMIRLWDLDRGRSIRTITSHTNPIRTLAVGTFRGKTAIASGSDDGLIRLWDGMTTELIKTFSGHKARVRTLDFSQDGRFLISGGNDRTVRVWDLVTSNPPQTYREHADWVWKVLFLNKNNSLISLSDDKTILHWNILSGEAIPFPSSQLEWLWTAQTNPQETILALGGDNQIIDLWNIETKEKVASFIGHQQRVKAIAFNKKGNLLASVSDDNTVRIWDVETQNCLQILEGSLKETRSIIFVSSTSNKSELVVSAGDDCLIRIYDLKTKNVTLLEGHQRSIWSLGYSADLDLLYSCGEDETIKSWNLNKRECIATFGVPKLYEGMKLNKVTGLNEIQLQSLHNLGAI